MKHAALAIILLLAFCLVKSTYGQHKEQTGIIEKNLPAYLKDRGTGMPTSFFGTYIRKNEWLVYPFFEYYLDNNKEYNPAELGYTSDIDFRGRYRATEELIYIGYGISDRCNFELEAATIQAKQYKSLLDNSAMPAVVEESGFGDVQTQLNYRWQKETQKKPELFSYLEINYPFQKNRKLIGTQYWEFKVGAGLLRGFGFGTISLKAGVEYNLEEKKIVPGGYTVEYFKKISDKIRVYAGIEGSEDEFELITEIQLFLSRNCFAKINNAFGITSKATDWAPELGILFSFQKK